MDIDSSLERSRLNKVGWSGGGDKHFSHNITSVKHLLLKLLIDLMACKCFNGRLSRFEGDKTISPGATA